MVHCFAGIDVIYYKVAPRLTVFLRIFSGPALMRDSFLVETPVNIMGPVVQSIVILTTSLRLVKYMRTTLSNTLLFLLEKCENLLQFFLQEILKYL